MQTNIFEFHVELIADEGKNLKRMSDEYESKIVHVPIGEEVNWIEVDEEVEVEIG